MLGHVESWNWLQNAKKVKNSFMYFFIKKYSVQTPYGRIGTNLQNLLRQKMLLNY